jgi:hypothetical protein
VAGCEDGTATGRDSHVMSTHLGTLRVLPSRHVVDDDELPAADLATARYVDREISDACTTAALCSAVAGRARSEGRRLVAGVLGDFAAGFTDEAAMLAPASLPDVEWPRRGLWPVESDADLDEWIRTISDSLEHSERTLRWIADRPDLPALARVMFDALATARHARRHLLLACSAIDI